MIDRYQGAPLFSRLAIALGPTLEFRAKGSFAPIDEMIGSGPFSLEHGQWTDDTRWPSASPRASPSAASIRTTRDALRPLLAQRLSEQHGAMLRIVKLVSGRMWRAVADAIDHQVEFSLQPAEPRVHLAAQLLKRELSVLTLLDERRGDLVEPRIDSIESRVDTIESDVDSIESRVD